MKRTELLDAALKKLEQVVKLLDRAGEEVLAEGRNRPTRISQLTDLARHFDDHRNGHAEANQVECN